MKLGRCFLAENCFDSYEQSVACDGPVCFCFTESSLDFAELSDFNLNDLCGGDCSLVTAAIWAEGISKITILAQSAINQEYYLIDYTKDRFNNSGMKSAFPQIFADRSTTLKKCLKFTNFCRHDSYYRSHSDNSI